MCVVKVVLVVVGNLKFKYFIDDENVLLLRLIMDVNLFKFFFYDILLFEGIIFDLFFGVVLLKVDYGIFFDIVKEVSFFLLRI